MAVAVAIGEGRNACTWSARKPFFFSHSASSSMSCIARAGMRGDEIRNEVLLLARLLRVLVEQLLEFVVGADARLHHLRQRALADRLGRDLQIAAGVVRARAPSRTRAIRSRGRSARRRRSAPS